MNRTRSRGVNGFSRNRRIVKDEPRFVTCIPRVAWSRDPSGTVASSMGCATEMCFPHRCASQITKESNSSALSKRRLLGMLPYFRW